MQQEAYNHKTIEKKWQKYWEEHQTFKTDVWDFSKPKYYVLDMQDIRKAIQLQISCQE